MAAAYPDVIGEYLASPERYETGGVQYLGYFEPARIAPEQVANLYLFMQNVLDVPLEVIIQTTIPRVGSGLFRSGKEVLRVNKPALKLEMNEGEAGLLTIPVTTTEDTPSGEYLLALEMNVTAKGRGNRTRPSQFQGKLGSKSLIDNAVGLNLASTLGVTYVEKPVKKATFTLQVAGKPQISERAPKLGHSYQTVWTKDQMDIFNRAVHELNLRQVKLKNELIVEAIYATLYSESVSRFADAGMPLRIGEAIIMAKILTYTCQYFLSSQDRANGLLVPIWERALDTNIDTTDALQVLRTIGYYHILRLAIALSFGIIARTAGRQPWSLEERQGVNDHIADNIETGQSLNEEFLYLPLLLAGTAISNKLILEGEDPRQTLALMRKAYEARTDLFLEDEMAIASKIYHQIFIRAMQ
ncbi:MAG: hypothetical protein JXM69_16105 [Anaerolineae bacterium]|nr:hypothetical protein [Anaerolineae bacterium]